MNLQKMKNSAYRSVKSAIKNGDLTRPKLCSKCGTSGGTSDGRAYIQAHHHDYSKPLDVEWICPKCHRKETPLPKDCTLPIKIGEENGYSKLTEIQVKAIKESNKTHRELAVIYGVHHTTIGRAKRGEYWKHIAAAPTKD